MAREKRTPEWYEEFHRQKRLKKSLEDLEAKIEKIFCQPKDFSKEEMNEALLLGDEEKLKFMRECYAKCHAKRDRLLGLLRAAPDAEARDEIMCKVTADPDAEF